MPVQDQKAKRERDTYPVWDAIRPMRDKGQSWKAKLSVRGTGDKPSVSTA